MQLARKKNRIAHAAFEALESRQMMSATLAPSGGNDTAAIQNAINSAPAGSTVNLGAGTYNVNSMLNLQGHTLAGVKGQTTIQWTGAAGQFAVDMGSNSEIEGLTITGAGVQVADSSSNVIITNNTIENTTGMGISDQGGCNVLQITHNTVQNIGGYAMVLYSINQANVDYNTITNIYEGIHAVNFLGTAAGNNCTFNYNTVTGITRHGIEIQSDWNNLSVGWNYVANFNVQPGGNSHIALSIATGPGAGGALAENVDVHDNVLLGNGPGVPSNPNYCFTAIEIMGEGSVVNHNYMANWGWGVLDGFTSNWQVTNNYYVGVTSMNGSDAVPESNGVAPSVDTGNVHLASWDGTVPSAWADAGADSTGVSTTPVATVAAPTNLTATSPNSSQINLNWQDNSGGKATYTIQIKSTYGSDPFVTVATLPAGTTSYNITGLNANWWYNITVTATVAGQNSSAAVVQDQVQPPSAVSTTPIVVTSGGVSTASGSSGSTTSSSTGGKTSSSSSGSKAKTTSTAVSSGTTSSGAKTSSSTSTTSTKAEMKAEKVELKAEKKADKAAELAAKKAAKGVSSAPPAVAASPGHGLQATFTKGKGKNKVSTTEVTADVDYTFSGASDTVPALSSPVGKTNYTVTWTGEVEAPTSGKYQIATKANDGIRVWIDGKEVIDDWNVQETTTDTGTIKLVAGQKYDIKVEYFQKTGNANAQLMWASKGGAREVIPDEDLYLPAAA